MKNSHNVKKHKKSNKKIRNATESEIDGIKFRSKLESFTYLKLKENGIHDFDYEKHKFTLLESFEYNMDSYESFSKQDRETKDKSTGYNKCSNKIRGITYKPDFVCIKEDKTGWIIEDKGFATDTFNNKWKTFKKFLVKNGYKVDLYLPNTQKNVIKTIEIIKSKYYV